MQPSRQEPLFGLIELGSDGTILYYHPEDREAEHVEFVGRNFFKDIASFPGSQEFETQVSSFLHGGAPASYFDFVFCLGGASVSARILLARTRENVTADGQESVFMHIKRV
ncbi:MAG TPA: hypothetical protein VF754_00815 [Pyrinomonadaceae bacterium]